MGGKGREGEEVGEGEGRGKGMKETEWLRASGGADRGERIAESFRRQRGGGEEELPRDSGDKEGGVGQGAGREGGSRGTITRYCWASEGRALCVLSE